MASPAPDALRGSTPRCRSKPAGFVRCPVQGPRLFIAYLGFRGAWCSGWNSASNHCRGTFLREHLPLMVGYLVVLVAAVGVMAFLSRNRRPR